MFSSKHIIKAIRASHYKNCAYRPFATQAHSRNRQTINKQEDLSILTRNVETIEKDLKAIHEFSEGINLQQQGKTRASP